MDLTVARKTLLDVLPMVGAVAQKKSPQDVLNYCLLTSADERLDLASTNTQTTALANCPAEVKRPGGVSVKAADLLAVVRSMPAGEMLRFRVLPQSLRLEVSGSRASFKLPGMEPKNFPKLPKLPSKWQPVEGGAFASAIKSVLHAVTDDEARTHLNGAMMLSDGSQVVLAAIDGHRLASVKRPIQLEIEYTIVPKRGLHETLRLLGLEKDEEDEEKEAPKRIRLAVADGQLFVGTETVTLVSKLMDVQFPPYEQVIPTRHKNCFNISRSELTDALKRVTLMADNRGGVHFNLDEDKLTLKVKNIDSGTDAEETLPIEYRGEDVAIVVNGRYVRDALAACQTDEVRVELQSELDQFLIKSGDDRYVIMPYRG